MYQNLNQKQACVLHAVRDWFIKLVCGPNPEQFFFYINGGAGTGKSHLIKCIYSEASKILCKLQRRSEEADVSNPTVLSTAFTWNCCIQRRRERFALSPQAAEKLKPPVSRTWQQVGWSQMWTVKCWTHYNWWSVHGIEAAFCTCGCQTETE